jgi:TonB family protein
MNSWLKCTLAAGALGSALLGVQAVAQTAAPAATAETPDTVVKIKCKVKEDGHLRDCSVLSVEPPGKDFGEEALRLSQQFKMKPRTGDAAKGPDPDVIIPISFVARPPGSTLPGSAGAGQPGPAPTSPGAPPKPQ